MYTREPNGVIQIRLNQDQFDILLFALGAATGASLREGSDDARARGRAFLALANEINNGNPDFTPYELNAAHADQSTEETGTKQ